MESDSPKLMTPFDCHTTPSWLYTLKLILPYTPDHYQRFLAVFIRFQEMQYTMKYFNGFEKKQNSENIIHDFIPYMDPSTQEMMEQMESMMSMFSEMSGSDLADLFQMNGGFNNE